MRFLSFESALVSALLGLAGLAIWCAVFAPEVSPHDREVMDELADLADSMEGVCYTSLSLANQGMWENDCYSLWGGDEYYQNPETVAAVTKCNADYERLKANPYWHLEDLLCQRDALRAKIEMPVRDRAKIGRRWWDTDARLIDGKWFCKNLFDGEPLELSCADRDAVN